MGIIKFKSVFILIELILVLCLGSGCSWKDSAIDVLASQVPTSDTEGPGASEPVANALTADLVLGQPDFVTNLAGKYGYSNGASVTYLSSLVVGSKLIVADSSARRVLIYNSVPTSNLTSPDVVIGQQDTGSIVSLAISAKTLAGPTGIDSDGTRLVIADSSNNRVLIYNSIPTSHFASADVVLGQPDFLSNTINNGGRSGSSLYNPRTVTIVGSKLIIGDSSNNRILIYNTIPTTNNAVADVVIGQPDMTSGTLNNGGLSSTSLGPVYGIASNGTKLYVSDKQNNRVLIYNTIPTSNNASADLVLGQTLFSTSAVGAGATRLSAPQGIFINGTKLYVCDTADNRVLIWNSDPVANGAAADVVVGQSNMTTYSSGITATTVNNPTSIYVSGGKLFLGDYLNTRLLIYNSVPTSNGAIADTVLGQHNMTSNFLGNSGSGITGTTLKWVREARPIGNQFVVSDYLNHRLLFYNSVPTTNNAVPDYVIGQSDFVSNSSGVSATKFNKPNSVTTDGTHLVVADFNNYRVLIYNSIPSTTGAAADVVLGQANMTARVYNSGGASATSMAYPYHVEVCMGTTLVVTDYDNNRIMIYNSIPTSNNAAADIILGQPNATSITPNAGGISASTLNNPLSAHCYGSKLFVVDRGNSRVLIWNTFPTVTGQAADVVIGQSNFNSSTANAAGALSASTLSGPTAVVTVAGGKLAVNDAGNHRIIIFNSIPTSHFAAADSVIGQDDLVTDGGNNRLGITSATFHTGFFLSSSGNQLFMADDYNNRILRFTIPD